MCIDMVRLQTTYWTAKSFLWFAWDAGLQPDGVYNVYRNGINKRK